MPLAHRGSQSAAAARVARDAMPLDEIEDEVGGRPGERVHAPSQVGAEIPFDHVGIGLQARIDLAPVAARSAPSRLLRLQQDHRRAFLRKVQGARQARESAAHDHHVGAHIAGKRRSGRVGPRGFSVKIRHRIARMVACQIEPAGGNPT